MIGPRDPDSLARHPDAYELPSLWPEHCDDVSASAWEKHRRKHLLALFESHVYGRTPTGGGVSHVAELSRVEGVCDGKADRIELGVTVFGPFGTKTVTVLLHLPPEARRAGPVAVFLGLNFKGNHATSVDPQIRMSQGHSLHDAARGSDLASWPITSIVERGYGVATLHNAELEGDYVGAAPFGVRGLFSHAAALSHQRAGSSWGAIGSWAWGLSRALDALERVPEVDSRRVIVVGHSRLGKAALWAAAQDGRFAAVVSNQSGCGGAKLFRHPFGESIEMITEEFPHWFCPNFASFGENPAALPVDQHQLLAMICPRPVHVSSAVDDANADPRGEQLATIHASPIMELFGFSGISPRGLADPGLDLNYREAASHPAPEAGTTIGGRLSYRLREGDHGIIEADWLSFLDFADENRLAL